VEGSIRKSKEEVLFDVTRAYELCLVSEANKYFMDSLVKGTSRLFEQQKELYDLGLIAKEDLDQVEFALIQAQTNQSSADYSYQNAVALLKLNMAYPMEDSIVLTSNLNEVVDQAVSLPLDMGSIDDNVDLDLLKKRKVLSEYDLKNTRMANLPRLNAFANHQYNYFSNDRVELFDNSNWFDQTVIGFSLIIPIVSSGERWSKTQQAKLAVKQDEYAISELERALQMQEVQYKNDFQNALQQLKMQEKNVSLAKRIYENALIKAEIGKENSLSVTQKYNQLVASQTQYVGAMMDVFNARLNLDKLYSKLEVRR
jgi:outer membrane protein TolC